MTSEAGPQAASLDSSSGAKAFVETAIERAALAHDRFERLLANAVEGQWSEGSDIDWSLPVALPNALPRSLLVKVVSQLFHGERATESMCRHLRSVIADPQALRCLAYQIQDEARHVTVYGRYLERLGDIAPANPAFESALATGLKWPGSDVGTVLAYHVVLEGEALNVQQTLTDQVDCPLLTAINRRATLDEARHVAFGKIYLATNLPAVDLAERDAIFHWLKSIWAECASGTLSGLGVYRVLLRSRVEANLTQAWQHHLRSFHRLGLIDDSTLAVELRAAA